MIPAMSAEVCAVFEQYPSNTQEQLAVLRQMIFDVAGRTDGVGELEETLKWGQISYLTPATKSGTTIRIDAIKADPDLIGMYFNCQITLVETFRQRYPDVLAFEDNRCVKFKADTLPVEAVEDCIGMALTYHLNKRRDKG